MHRTKSPPTGKDGGAKGETRTLTGLAHWHLKPARLPIPPLSLWHPIRLGAIIAITTAKIRAHDDHKASLRSCAALLSGSESTYQRRLGRYIEGIPTISTYQPRFPQLDGFFRQTTNTACSRFNQPKARCDFRRYFRVCIANETLS
jgi:hypothetical protein